MKRAVLATTAVIALLTLGACNTKPSHPRPRPHGGGRERDARRPGQRPSTAAPTVEKRTAEERQCDPNYGGACVPIASDVDCAGGSGNGPGYAQGPVRVVGSAVYDLGRDGDGIACDT